MIWVIFKSILLRCGKPWFFGLDCAQFLSTKINLFILYWIVPLRLGRHFLLHYVYITFLFAFYYFTWRTETAVSFQFFWHFLNNFAPFFFCYLTKNAENNENKKQQKRSFQRNRKNVSINVEMAAYYEKVMRKQTNNANYEKATLFGIESKQPYRIVVTKEE